MNILKKQKRMLESLGIDLAIFLLGLEVNKYCFDITELELA